MPSDAAILERHDSAQEDRQEAERAARDARIEANRENLHNALQVEMMAAMNGQMDQVSIAVYGKSRTIHDYSDLQTAVLNVIEREDCADALLAVLSGSTCTHVSTLKQTIALAHALKHAHSLAVAVEDAGVRL